MTLDELSIDGARNLAAAIVERAVIDYRKACNDYAKGKLSAHDALNIIEPIRRFFGSEYYDAICGVDPDIVIRKLDSELEYRRLKHESI